jgi:hypothetical protein
MTMIEKLIRINQTLNEIFEQTLIEKPCSTAIF